MDRYDLIVIGGGPGGYTTAIRAAQLGLRAACVERSARLGGAGVVTGCFPSRILLHASGIYAAARDGEHAILGVEGAATLNLARMMGHKAATVGAMSDDIGALLRRHGVRLHHGHARLDGPGRVALRGPDGAERILLGDHVVIATGSDPVPLPGADFDHHRILDSADILSLDRVPEHLAIVGGGATGIETGSIWQRLGARVTVVERHDSICSWLDEEVTVALLDALRRQGLEIRLSTEVVGIETSPDGVRLRLRMPDGSDGSLDAEMVLVAVGRRPALADLALQSAGLAVDAQGGVSHDRLRTRIPGLWVVGDAAGGAMLAHKAEEEAVACAEQIAGLPGYVDYATMPTAIFTNPEVAMIGRTERELRQAGVLYRIGRASFATNPRARIRGRAEGFVKLLVEECTNLVVGAHLIGPGAAELVSEVAVAIEASTICEDLARISYAHPTLSEALRQAAMAVGGWMTQG